MNSEILGALLLWLIILIVVVTIVVYALRWLTAARPRRCRSCAPASSARRW
ncbi:MAG: hypothetical protein R3F55_16365 [Alphaproteobacteria bacterium]